jgi:hypothetical protein
MVSAADKLADADLLWEKNTLQWLISRGDKRPFERDDEDMLCAPADHVLPRQRLCKSGENFQAALALA